MTLPARAVTVVVDVETTGLGRARGREDGVVQVGLAWRDPASGQVVAWSEACDPGAAFYVGGRAAAAFAKNGMTPERLADARPAAEVAATLRERLRGLAAAHGRVDLRAYNVDFDRPFLEAQPWGLVAPWGPCLMRQAEAWLGFRPKLVDACAALGVRYPGRAHDACADAHAALLLHEAMLATLAPAAR